MAAADQSTRLMLTGHLPFLLLGAAFLALPLAFLLLRLYKRAVVRAMRSRDAAETTSLPLASADLDARQNAVELRRIALNSPVKAAGIYALAGIAYAFIMSAATIRAGQIPFSLERLLVVACNYAWPAVLGITLTATPTWRGKAVVVLSYFALLCLGAVAGLGAQQIVTLWLFANFGPTLLLLFFLARPLRAVGPLVFTFVLVALVGCELALDALAYDVRNGGPIAHAALAIGFSAATYFSAVAILGFAAFSVLGWAAMRRIGRRYERNKVTDQSITLDAIWIVFAVVHGVFLSLNGAAWVLAALVAFAIYKLVLLVAFPLCLRGGKDIVAPRLLILRVFSLGRRSQRLFNAIAQHWRYAGSIQLIAGPDLATTTVEPHEFLAFLGGKLARRFIDSEATFRERAAEIDLARDFDGRFRVTDFFCHDNTWRMVLSQLVRASDAVLMDLRGFTRANAGCVFELQELSRLATPSRVVFVIDESTEKAFVDETLGQSASTFRFIQRRGRRGELRRIVGAICAAAEG